MINTTIQYDNIIIIVLLLPRPWPRRGHTLEAEARTLEAEARTLEAEAKTLEAEARTLEAKAEAKKFWPSKFNKF